ncbi:NACHT domain protein [Macrophomina phaseolina MS6]|uniref:NACHT domain protein n=1 Tax=Macrophomina phaseolina (strain MS6) TaxID=1126212 RepID=K2R9N8_MACPH|nr:NACHT domain protein [Macrophomina phaseolina MS6]
MVAHQCSRLARLTTKEAVARLEQSITAGDARDFEKTTLVDVRQAAVEVEAKLAASQSLRNTRRIESFLNGIEHYSKVVEVVCNGTPYLPWIWAPIKLLLQLSSEYLSSFEKLIDAYAQIAETFPRLDRLSSAFENESGFQELLAMFYADILEFHRRAYKFFRARSWKRFFDSSWGRFDARFKTILSNLAQHADLIDREANAVDIAKAKSMRNRLNDELSRREKADALVHLASAMSWLNLTGIPQQEDELDGLLGRCHPTSCDWLLQNRAIAKWIGNDQAERLAWIFGKPGAGQQKRALFQLDPSFKRETVPRSLFFLHIPLKAFSPKHSPFEISHRSGIGLSEQVIPYIIDNYASKTPTASAEKLRTLLPHVLSTLPSGRIIVDGLDECDNEQQRFILKDMWAIAQNAGPDWKILISSREIPSITQQLSNLSLKSKVSLSEEKNSINSAISAFIDQKLKNLPQDTPNVQQRAELLKQKLKRKSHGMYYQTHGVCTQSANPGWRNVPLGPSRAEEPGVYQ